VTKHRENVVAYDRGSVGATLPSVLVQTDFHAVAIDSRAVEPGDLFVALPGEHVDGHRYVAAAFERGAWAALVRRSWLAEAAPELVARATLITGVETPETISWPALIAVDDPLETLQAHAAVYRARFTLPVIGITGSIGKTSTKELVGSVLGQYLQTLSSIKSFNNEIGLPLTLLRLRPEHQVAVLEMGTYGPGDIALLCDLAHPTYGIVTNVGISHLERMGSREVVAKAKGELIAALPPDGAAILNGDDARVLAMRSLTTARSITYGLGPANDVRGSDVESHGLAGISFTVSFDGEQHRIDTPLRGTHNVYTALAAITIARELGLPWSTIAAGLQTATTQPRLVVRPAINGATIIDDSYNSSPDSSLAAFQLLSETPGRHVAVLGDMAELGSEEESGHRAVGLAAVGVVDLLVVVGAKARVIGQAALEASTPLHVQFFDTNQAAIDWLRTELAPGDHVLVKGARVAVTEEIVAALKMDEAG